MAKEHGLLLVDTKYEFGLSSKGRAILIDEIHTPDSSQYWIASSYEKRYQGHCAESRSSSSLPEMRIEDSPDSSDMLRSSTPQLLFLDDFDELIRRGTTALHATMSKSSILSQVRELFDVSSGQEVQLT